MRVRVRPGLALSTNARRLHLQFIIFGIVTGSTLAIATIGFAMVRQTENFLNIAHAQMMALGAFIGAFLVDRFDMNIFLAGAVTVVAVGLLGVVLSAVVFRPVRHQGGTVLLFTSIGLALMIYAVIIAIFSTRSRIYSVNFGGLHEFGGVNIATGELVIVGLALAGVIALQLFLGMTSLGRSVRAVASNGELAQVRGVPVNRVSNTIWFISSAFAAMAGVMIGVLSSVNAELGWHNSLIILAAAVLGGLRSIGGVIVAGLLLGIVMDVSALYIATAYRPVVAFGVLVAVLIVKPEGIFSVVRRKDSVVT
jgi:branched-chain amino acid transport system permease protein